MTRATSNSAAIMARVAARLLGEPNKRLSRNGELRFGTKGALKVDLNENRWCDHAAGDEGGGPAELVMRELHLSRAEAQRWLRTEGYTASAAPRSPKGAASRKRAPAKTEPPPPAQADAAGSAKPRRCTARYAYRDHVGNVIAQKSRYSSEPRFSWQRPKDGGGWESGLGAEDDKVKPGLYRLPELLASAADATIFLVEGEKDCETLASQNLTATTNPDGAGSWSLDKPRPELVEPLRGHFCVILPDNDKPGRDHAANVAACLRLAGIEHVIIELPDLDEKGDVTDWLQAGRTVADLMMLVDPDPAPDGDLILDEVAAYLRRYMIHPTDEALIAHVLWIAHAHIFESFDTTPRFGLMSPEPGSGKTRGLTLTKMFVPRPIETSNGTSAYLIRRVGQDGGVPTLLIDEIDAVFGPKTKDNNEDLRAFVNAGHRRGATFGRCKTIGREIIPEDLPAHAPIILAGLNDLPPTIASRTIRVDMRRRKRGERIENFRQRTAEAETAPIKHRLAEWSETIRRRARSTYPALPSGIVDRDADNWEPLFTIADFAGGRWPAAVRAAAASFMSKAADVPLTLGIRLLSDLRMVFGDEVRMHTVDIINALIKIDEAPWATLKNRRDPIDSYKLSALLSPYDIKPKKLRIGTVNLMGYEVENSIADAWERYLPPVVSSPANPEQPEQSEHAAQSGASGRRVPEPKSSPEQASACFHNDVRHVPDVPTFQANGADIAGESDEPDEGHLEHSEHVGSHWSTDDLDWNPPQ